jgi:hypothetical protein
MIPAHDNVGNDCLPVITLEMIVCLQYIRNDCLSPACSNIGDGSLLTVNLGMIVFLKKRLIMIACLLQHWE